MTHAEIAVTLDTHSGSELGGSEPEGGPSGRSQSNGGEPSQPGRQPIAINADSSPQLSGETNDLLRRRLRSASLLLCAGFLAFFVRRLFQLDQLQTPLEKLLLVDHALMTVVTGLVGFRLCTNCSLVLRNLRTVELIVFGGSALFFVFVSYSMLLGHAQQGYLLHVTPIWLMLIFTYALFIPNQLKRAAIVIGTMALCPVAVMTFAYATSPDVREVVANNSHFRGFLIEGSLIMALAALSSISGVVTIGTLRRQAFHAKQLGQYRLRDQIGEGGMGEVYLAEHLLLKRPCAIKLIRHDRTGDSRALARFEREVRATAKLTHPNTIEIYDYGRADDGTFYYVMEYLPGMNLGDLIRGYGPMPAGRVIHLLCQTCDALQEAHDSGLVHRDIKPANIFAAHRGGIFDVAKLLDFGLVRPAVEMSSSELTADGSITGSPAYMSPEQFTGDSTPDARSDIYSLGVVAYHLLTGAHPFEHDKPMQVMLAHVREEVRPPSELNDSIPADVEQVVLRCLEKDPEYRYHDAASLRNALLACGDSGTWSREAAAEWWQCHGCPKKKALDHAVLEAVG